MPIFSVDDIRKSWGSSWANASDESLVDAYSRQIGQDPAEVAIQLGMYPGRGGKNAKRLSASVDQYQSNLYGLGEAVSNKFGLDRVGGWMGERRRANELEANVASQRAREMGAIESFRDIGGVGDALDYAVGLGIQSAPYLGEALVGGLGARAAMGGTRAALGAATQAGDAVAAARAANRIRAGQTIGGTTATYPSAVGDILSNQREQADVTDLGSAAALGIPYAALNALGLEGAVMRGRLARSGIDALDNIPGIRGGLARAGATGARTALVEGSAETGQEGLNQLGRMAVDPNETFLNPRSMERFEESFVGGATLGGLGGAGLGGWRRSAPPQPVNLLPGANPGVETQQYPLALVGERGLATGAPPNLGSVPPYVEPTRIDPLAPFQPSLPAPVTPVGSQNYDPNVMYVTPGGTVGPMSAMSGLQPDLFGGPDVPYGMGPVATAETPLAPTPDTQTLDMFEQDPTALVRTEYGLQQIRAALRNANGGKLNAQLQRFIPEFSRAIEQGPEAVNSLIAKYDNNRSTLKPEVFETASQMAQDFQSRMTNAMAARGLNLARPGSVTGAIPQSGATEQQMREGNQARAEQERIAADAARAQAQVIDEQETRAIEAMLRNDEEQNRLRDEQETRAIEAMIQDETDLRAMESQIPQRQEKLSPGGQRRLFTNQEMGRVIPNAAPQPEPAVELDQTGQRKLFDSLGRPVTQPKAKKAEPAQKEPQRAVQEPSAAPVSPRKGARGGKPVGEEVPGQGQTAGEGETKPKKPRKAKVKAEVGGQQVEFEVDNVDEKITAMRADIDKYKAFVACLRKK